MSNKNFGISGKGYYIALILCAAAIGITGYLYYQNQNTVQEVSIQEPALTQEVIGTQTPAAATKPVETKPASKGSATKPEPVQSAAASPAASTPQTLRTASPVDGDTIFDYAMDCLSYNETTRDWRVHNGIDLAAPEGTEVKAAAEGTVYTTYEDDTMGHTVVIRHLGGYTTRYSNLREDLAVSAGDHVALGQTVGYVGSTALIESAMDSHVHFCVSYQDNPIHPMDFLSLS